MLHSILMSSALALAVAPSESAEDKNNFIEVKKQGEVLKIEPNPSKDVVSWNDFKGRQLVLHLAGVAAQTNPPKMKIEGKDVSLVKCSADKLNGAKDYEDDAKFLCAKLPEDELSDGKLDIAVDDLKGDKEFSAADKKPVPLSTEPPKIPEGVTFPSVTLDALKAYHNIYVQIEGERKVRKGWIGSQRQRQQAALKARIVEIEKLVTTRDGLMESHDEEKVALLTH